MAPITWVLGNWKQNLLRAPASQTAQAIASALPGILGAKSAQGELRVGFAPSYLSIDAAAPFARPHSPVYLLAQDCAAQECGAFTGEVGAGMLREAGVEAVIVGHSERRALFGESDAFTAAKVANALAHGLTVVLCIGEALEARESGVHEKTVISQLSGSLAQVKPEQVDASLVLAYEPVWAIGTGRTASPEQARDMHRTIRAWMGQTFGARGSDRSILYGGSVKPGNAAELIAAGDIDGFLVGGASLDPESFLGIIRAAASAPRS